MLTGKRSTRFHRPRQPGAVPGAAIRWIDRTNGAAQMQSLELCSKDLRMLVLSRKREEKVIIFIEGHQPVEVTVVEIRGDKVRLGFQGEKEIVIHRAEVARAIERNGEQIGGGK